MCVVIKHWVGAKERGGLKGEAFQEVAYSNQMKIFPWRKILKTVGFKE